MPLIKKSSTEYPLCFLLVESSDHITGLTGASPAVKISKAGASGVSPSGAVSEIDSSHMPGWYAVAGNATDSNTAGPLLLHASAASADPVDKEFEVVLFDPQDAVRLGLTALPNAAAEAAGGLYTRGSGAGQLNQNANGQLDANLVDWKGSAPNALQSGRVDGYLGAVAAGAIAAASFASGALDAVWSTAARLLTAGTNIVLAKGTGLTGLNDLSLAAIWEEPIASHDGVSGSMAEALENAAGASDPSILLDATDGVETGVTLREAMRLILAASAGKINGAATVTVHVRDTNDSKNRITATVDGDGNRTAVTLDPS